MILIYYNARSNSRSNGSSPAKPIALTSGPPIFSLDLRPHSQYIHRYLHQNKFPDKFKHQNKRALNASAGRIEPTSNGPLMLNFSSSALDETADFLDSNRTFNAQSAPSGLSAPFDSNAPSSSNVRHGSIVQSLASPDRSTFEASTVLKRKLRELDLELDQKANELLASAQFISAAYAGRLAYNFSTNREKFILKLSKLKERDDGEYVCRADFKWSRTLISVVNLFVIGE